METTMETMTIGGGCFWCTEAVFQNIKGVESVVSGYAGGHVENPSYREVCGKKTGHAEVIQITYDSSLVSFEQLLEIFWATHDPTTKNQQGNDRGPQYRSVIYYHNDEQKEQAIASLQEVGQPMWQSPIVTEISPLNNFYAAEAEHQNFYRANGSFHGYCTYVITPKVMKARQKFAHLWT